MSLRLPGISSKIGLVTWVRYWSIPCVDEVYVATIGLPANVLDVSLIGLCVFGRK